MPKKYKEEVNKEELIYDDKEYYTLEDLIGLTKVLERTETEIRNTKADIKAKEGSIERLERKIQNAKNYIEEIEEHKKSIFEFWKFVNKDNALGLNEPEKEEIETRQIEKTFDYEEDIEEIGKKLDKQNREKLSREETNSIFIANTECLNDINTLKEDENPDFSESIEKIKEEALKDEVLFSSEEFDIFGGMSEDKTKISNLGNAKHREVKKSKFRILEITKNTENEEYIKTLKEITKYIDEAIEKSKIGITLNAYIASNNTLNNTKYSILYLNPQNAIDEIKDSEKINLYSIKLNEETKGIPLTNIIYYDNNNKTLPLRNECIRQNISRYEQNKART